MSTENPNSQTTGATAKWLIRLLYLAAAVALIAELLIHRHSVFSFESWFGFYALFGFASYVFIVRSAMLIRRLLQREEDYYD